MRLPSLTLATRVTACFLAALAVALLALGAFVGWGERRGAEASLAQRLERDLALLEGMTATLSGNGAWRITPEGRLARGDLVLDGANAVTDLVSRGSGGVATIFRGDERVATSVQRPDGTRAGIQTFLSYDEGHNEIQLPGSEAMAAATTRGSWSSGRTAPAPPARGWRPARRGRRCWARARRIAAPPTSWAART